MITNHALVLTDCRYRGGVLGIGGTVDTVLFDEADALPEAARSVADECIGLDYVAHIAATSDAAASEACRELARLCAHETTRGAPRLLAHCAGRAAIVERVRQIRVAFETAAGADDDAAEEAALLAARLRTFLECADGGTVATVATAAIAAIAPGETPALAVVHHAPVRLLRYVFDTTQAAFLVSATLAAPGARSSPNDLLRALGIGPGTRAPARLNAPGWADLQPRRYGEMDFRFADRSVPAPIRHLDGVPVSDPGHLDYVAQAIEAARKSGRVLVLVHELPARRGARRAGARRRGACAGDAARELARGVPGRRERRAPHARGMGRAQPRALHRPRRRSTHPVPAALGRGRGPGAASSNSSGSPRRPSRASSSATAPPPCGARSPKGSDAGSGGRTSGAQCGFSTRGFRFRNR